MVKEALNKCRFDLKVIDAQKEFSNASTMIKERLTDKLLNTISLEEKRKLLAMNLLK